MTNQSGQYRFPYLTPGGYLLTVTAAGYQQQQTTATADGRTPVNVSLLPATLVALTGRVTDAVSGQPVAGVFVSPINGSRNAMPNSVRTDQNGLYRFDHILIGSATLQALVVNYDRAVSTVFIDGTMPLNFALTPLPQAPLMGTVTHAATSAPVANATVVVYASGGYAAQYPPDRQPTTVTDASGRFRFDALPVGGANVKATAAGFNEARASVVIDGTNTLDFKLQPTQ